jgi:hypothetical protein
MTTTIGDSGAKGERVAVHEYIILRVLHFILKVKKKIQEKIAKE